MPIFFICLFLGDRPSIPLDLRKCQRDAFGCLIMGNIGLGSGSPFYRKS